MNAPYKHGTAAWFEMVGSVMCEAAARAALPPGSHFSLVERYLDGAPLSEGLIQGLRFDIQDGRPSFRVGATLEEQGDITVEVTAAASRELNALRSADPRYLSALARLQASGELKIRGDLGRLGPWFTTVHDPIVDRTTQ